MLPDNAGTGKGGGAPAPERRPPAAAAVASRHAAIALAASHRRAYGAGLRFSQEGGETLRRDAIVVALSPLPAIICVQTLAAADSRLRRGWRGPP
jgi:hypothetical protein